MAKKPKLLVVGSLVMDMIVSTGRFPGAGETVIGQSFRIAPGGKGANQAVQAARLGADVDLVGMVGADEFGESLRKTVANAGVDVRHVLTDPYTSSAVGNVQLEAEEKGTQNRICVVPGANMQLTPEDIQFLEDTISDYQMVILQLEIPLQVNAYVAKIAKENGVPVMLNCAPYQELPEELLKNLEYLCPNEHEASDMAKIKVSDLETAEMAARKIHEMGVSKVLITLGHRGALLFDGEKSIFQPAVPNVKAVDPTAAGDSFIGAFCTGICYGLSQKDALCFANQTAALTVAQMGAMPSLPDKAAVLLELEHRYPSLWQQLKEENYTKEVNHYLRTVQQELSYTLKDVDEEGYMQAAQLIWDSQENGGRLHITGIGKPAHIANYAASLISSTGTPTYFLHGTEAVHGSCGQLKNGDVVICISNSGETVEMKATATAIRKNGCKVISLTGNPDSWLSRFADVSLVAGAKQEGGPLNRAPRISILAETIALQILSVILQAKRKITPQEYVQRHPGGALGQLRAGE